MYFQNPLGKPKKSFLHSPSWYSLYPLECEMVQRNLVFDTFRLNILWKYRKLTYRHLLTLWLPNRQNKCLFWAWRLHPTILNTIYLLDCLVRKQKVIHFHYYLFLLSVITHTIHCKNFKKPVFGIGTRIISKN